MTGYQVVNHHWNCLPLFVLIIFGICACSQTSLPTTEVVAQPALPTPTLEPTFTPSPSPADTPTPAPTSTPTPEPTPASEQATLSGRILDHDTNQPITDAQVSAGTTSTTTDADGHYTLIDLPPGQYVLSVTHPDYDPGLSSIFTVAAGVQLAVDVPLYAPDTSPYPEDPMLTNPLDPNGAPTREDAERLAREQGLTGEVVSIRETKLSGEFLVNYKIGDDVRAAVAEVRHEVWELVDDTGRKWWIIKVCGNLASHLPEQGPIATPAPKPLPPMAEVLVDGLVVRECAAEDCGEVGSVPLGDRVEVFGCMAHETGGWCEVGWSGGRGWCTGQSLRQLAVAEVVPVVELLLPTATPGVVAAEVRKVIFTSHREDNSEIYVINTDGSGLTRLTNSTAHESHPTWSPNGQQIAFVASDNLNSDIYVMKVNGSSVTRLTDNPGKDWRPVWSPDGKKIAFESEREHKNNIYLMNADGSGLRRLVEDDYRIGQDRNPTWSPDSRQIAFEYINNAIYVINADGTGLKALTTDKNSSDQEPAWSPDGQKIAFNCRTIDQDNQNEICVMNTDGSDQKNLTNHPAADSRPTWSPDGKKIAFLSDRDGNSDIYLMNADGSGLIRLTNDPAMDSNPAWSPDGRQIAFFNDFYVYVMNADGSDLRRLTDYYVSWFILDWLQ